MSDPQLEQVSDSVGEASDVEAEEEGAPITEPFDPSRIRIGLWQPTVELLMKRVKEDEIDLTPDFQRKAGLWKPAPKSRLIESLLIKIPLPAFYLDNTDEERLVVVDGLQRLTTLREYMVDQTLSLVDLEFLKEMEGKKFDDLPRPYRRRIEETQVTAFTIEKGTPEEVKFNIFKRINTGGLPLSPQEIRHALNKGPGRELLRELAESSEFQAATGGGVRDDRMADREMILRFFAFRFTPPEQYVAGDFDVFLSQAFAKINKMTDAQRAELDGRARRMMLAAPKVFGNRAFRKEYKQGEARKPVNKALFEAWAVNLDALTDSQLRALAGRKGRVQDGFHEAMARREFDVAVSQGTGDPNKVRLRFNTVRNILQAALAEEEVSA